MHVRKLSVLSFCRLAQADKTDNTDKTDMVMFHHKNLNVI